MSLRQKITPELSKIANRTELSTIARVAADHLNATDAKRLIDQAAAAVANKWSFSHSTEDIAACEAAARRVRLCSQTVGAASGAATGVGGLLTLPADIASSLFILSGTVHATASAYGYQEDSAADQAIRLRVIDLAMSSSSNGRRDSKAAIDDLLHGLVENSDGNQQTLFGDIARTILPSILKNLVGWAISRVGGKAVPVASVLTGGYLGYQLQSRAWKAAAYTYNKRWVIERSTLPKPDNLLTHTTLLSDTFDASHEKAPED